MLQIFNYNDNQIRIVDRKGDPWFVGKDVAEVLGYSNTRKAIIDHVDDRDKGVTKCDTPGGQQEIAIINESGLYSLIMASKLPNAIEFRHWVTSEVLPAIRKHGMYATPITAEQLIANPSYGIELLKALVAEQAEKAQLQNQIAELVPKATYCDMVLRSPNLVSVTIIAKDYGMSAPRFNKLLHEMGIQYKQGNTWILYAKYEGQGYTRFDTFHYVDGKTGEDGSRVSLKWTQKGRLFLYECLKGHGILPVMGAA